MNVADAQCITLVALWQAAGGSGPGPSCNAYDLHSADFTCDGAVNVADSQALVYLVVNGSLAATLDGNANGCADACEGLELGRPTVPPVVFTGTTAGGTIVVESLNPWAGLPTPTGGIFTGNSIRSELLEAPTPQP